MLTGNAARLDATNCYKIGKLQTNIGVIKADVVVIILEREYISSAAIFIVKPCKLINAVYVVAVQLTLAKKKNNQNWMLYLMQKELIEILKQVEIIHVSYTA